MRSSMCQSVSVITACLELSLTKIGSIVQYFTACLSFANFNLVTSATYFSMHQSGSAITACLELSLLHLLCNISQPFNIFIFTHHCLKAGFYTCGSRTHNSPRCLPIIGFNAHKQSQPSRQKPACWRENHTF